MRRRPRSKQTHNASAAGGAVSTYLRLRGKNVLPDCWIPAVMYQQGTGGNHWEGKTERGIPNRNVFVRLQYSVTEKAAYEPASIYYKIQLDLFSMQNFTSKKGTLFIANSEITFKPSSFLSILRSMWQLELVGKSTLGNFSPQSSWLQGFLLKWLDFVCKCLSNNANGAN